ncbi:MAG: ester cyclase [Xanthomonadales bacterium]|nr:ester cyclase [Xanthomonadales bacterium]
MTDYILGITFEIWEEGRVDKILEYYSEDCPVYGLDGITRGAAQMVEQTHATLKAFPDRLLLGDDVIWTGTVSNGFSSHRVLSPMTNLGDSAFGPATGRSVRVMNMADCEITDSQISREWLVRDNLALVRQLGFDPMKSARALAAGLNSELSEWLRQEYKRVIGSHSALDIPAPWHGSDDAEMAHRVLTNCWLEGNRRQLESVYAPYSVLHRAPLRIYSGRDELLAHYDAWRRVMPDAKISIDHVCGQPFGADGRHIAVRWGVAGTQQDAFSGCEASGQPLFILGVTHWRVLAGRIISEWTVFDELALMAQSLSRNG